jgi:glycosyltransferase involved in cell wall biosynthesis
MVSVIITTYNRRKFLKEALFSVIDQDYQDKEIIVVDDGSIDNSYEEVKEFPVRYVRKANGGISSARNYGIAISKGEYISFLDVDDLWLKGKLSTQMELMKRSEVFISYTDEIWVRNGKRLNQKLRHKKFSGHIFERCLPLCIISPSSVVIKREVFDKIGLFDESMPVCEDYDMWLRITSKYEVLFIEKSLIIKQGGHEDQLSKSVEAMDRFRIGSLVKILNGDVLNSDMKNAVKEELKKKCGIYINGAIKRGKTEEMRRILELIKNTDVI